MPDHDPAMHVSDDGRLLGWTDPPGGFWTGPPPGLADPPDGWPDPDASAIWGADTREEFVGLRTESRGTTYGACRITFDQNDRVVLVEVWNMTPDGAWICAAHKWQEPSDSKDCTDEA